MQFFGLISILLTIAVGVWWASGGFQQSAVLDETSDTTRYEEALDSAQAAADSISESFSVGKKIEIYDGISFTEDVEVVDLSGRGLSGSLKAEIRHLSKLKTLNLSNNNFTGLPAEVGQLTQLKTLNLSNNPFTGLPHELGNLQNLEVLDLTGTHASDYDVDIVKPKLPADTVILTD